MNYPDNTPISYCNEQVSTTFCRERSSYSCLAAAAAFLVLLIAFTLGLILGAVYFETLLPVLASIIAFGAALAAVAIALLIYRGCRRNR